MSKKKIQINIPADELKKKLNLKNGDKGEAFKYEDFTPEQLESLKVKGDAFKYEDFTPEQIEALKIKGDKGDSFKYEDFTAEQLETLRGKDFTFDNFTPEQIKLLKGEQGSPDTPKQIKEKLDTLKGKDRLTFDNIDGLEKEFKGVYLEIDNIKKYQNSETYSKESHETKPQGGVGFGTNKQFVNLADTPDSYKDKGGRVIRVKADESGLEFVEEQDLSSLQQTSFETFSKNLNSYPYTIEETSSTVTTIVYNTGSGSIIKTITEVSPTVTTIVFSGDYTLPITTKTITDGSPITITYS